MLRKFSSKIKGKFAPNNVRSLIRSKWHKMKNPNSEGGVMLKRIAIGLGICTVSIAASLLGLRG